MFYVIIWMYYKLLLIGNYSFFFEKFAIGKI